VYISKSETVYKLAWNINGRQFQNGIGILAGSILSVGYLDTTDDTLRDVGVVSFRIIDTNTLEGTWSSIFGEKIGYETLIWQSSGAYNPSPNETPHRN
jgi:hypothetical protein